MGGADERKGVFRRSDLSISLECVVPSDRGVIPTGVLATTIAAPAGIWFAGRTELPLTFIGAAVLFLPLFVFLPKVIRLGMKDTDAAIEASGRTSR
jgi:hypothetical protein